MPIYEYQCRKCGKKFEHLQSASEATPSCPACKASTVTKQMSAFAITNQNEMAGPCGPAKCGGCQESPHCPFSGGRGF